MESQTAPLMQCHVCGGSPDGRCNFCGASDTMKGSTLIGPDNRLTSDPVGAHAIFEQHGRDYLVTVTDTYQIGGVWCVHTRHFNGEEGPSVALGLVSLLNREY